MHGGTFRLPEHWWWGERGVQVVKAISLWAQKLPMHFILHKLCRISTVFLSYWTADVIIYLFIADSVNPLGPLQESNSY